MYIARDRVREVILQRLAARAAARRLPVRRRERHLRARAGAAAVRADSGSATCCGGRRIDAGIAVGADPGPRAVLSSWRPGWSRQPASARRRGRGPGAVVPATRGRLRGIAAGWHRHVAADAGLRRARRRYPPADSGAKSASVVGRRTPGASCPVDPPDDPATGDQPHRRATR
jgi:hypothetical protein